MKIIGKHLVGQGGIVNHELIIKDIDYIKGTDNNCTLVHYKAGHEEIYDLVEIHESW